MSHDFSHILLGAMFNLKTDRKIREEGSNTPHPQVFDTPEKPRYQRDLQEKLDGSIYLNSCHETLGPPHSSKKTWDQTLPKNRTRYMLLPRSRPSEPNRTYKGGAMLFFWGVSIIWSKSHAILHFPVMNVETMNISGLA